MDNEEREEFLQLISKYGFVEDDFEITDNITYPPPGTVGFLSGTRTLKHKESGAVKTYQVYGPPPTWFTQLEDDFASGLYKIRH